MADPTSGFDRFLRGMQDLREGFGEINKERKAKKKEDDKAEALTRLRELYIKNGGDPSRADLIVQGELAGVEGMSQYVRMLEGQFTRPAKEQITRLIAQQEAEQQAGTLTPQRKAAYQDQLTKVGQTEEMYRILIEEPKLRSERNIKDTIVYTDPSTGKTVSENRDMFRSRLRLEEADQRFKKLRESFDKGRIDELTFKRTLVPQVTDTKQYEAGLSSSDFIQRVKNHDPDISNPEVQLLWEAYKGRADHPEKVKSIMDTLEEMKFKLIQIGGGSRPEQGAKPNSSYIAPQGMGAQLQQLATQPPTPDEED